MDNKFIYWEVHGYTEEEDGELDECNMICTDEALARSFALMLLNEARCDSVSFDKVESCERLVL